MKNIDKISKEILCASEFHQPAKIKKFFDKLPQDKREEILSKFFEDSTGRGEKSLLHQILVLCKKIVRYDLSFENKNSEIENAKRVTEKIQKDYDDLLKLIEKVDPKDVELVKEMVSMLDHPWMNVLGDQLRLKDNLKEKLSKLRYHLVIKNKDKQKQLDEFISRMKIPSTEELNLDVFKPSNLSWDKKLSV